MKEEFYAQLVQIAFSALGLVLTALIAYVFPKLEALLKAKVGAANYDKVKEFTWSTVSWLAQSPVFEALDPAEKKERAIAEIVQYADQRGIPITYSEIDKLIEAVYIGIKHELVGASG